VNGVAPSSPQAETLDQELAVEIGRLELLMVRGFQGISTFGTLAGLAVAGTISRDAGLAAAATFGVLLLWFLVLGRRMARGRVSASLRAASIVVESTFPWLFLAMIAAWQGAVHALSSWVPPLLFCVLMVMYAARLRARPCLFIGIAGAIVYALVYWGFVYPRLPPNAPLSAQPAMQVLRSSILVLGGVVGAVLARGLRRAIFRAESAVRAKDLFSKYRLVRKIASGGMGAVYEAIYCPEGGFERRVAIKRIHPHLAADEKFVSAFRAEAELSARLAHPAIVQVMDFGRVGDSFFLAMEHVDGVTLHTFIARLGARSERLPPSLVGYVLREILGALVYAQEVARGADGRPLRVVHRDLCPANVLLSRNGEVKLTDFGIARSLRDANSNTTKNVVGHVGYMAPEQARALPFDTRADLFPAGVIAWELFTLRPLFRRENESASLIALLSDKVLPVAIERPDLDERWSSFVDRAVDRNPDERFSSATAMLEALDAIPESRGAGATHLASLVQEVARVLETNEEEREETTVTFG
jgi:hypothetical protein